MEKDTGTVLQLHPLGEYGLIVCWSTLAHGIVRTAARNARKPGSEMSGRLDLFHECELVFRPAPRGSDLHSLAGVELLNPRLPLRSQLLKLRLASYMARLLLATVEPGATDSEWHRLIAGALDYVAQNPARRAVLRHFEKRLAMLHGVYSPEAGAHNCLLRHFQHLPAGRAELLAQLPELTTETN